MVLINVGGQPIDANDGAIHKLDYQIGNRTFGQKVFLSGTERPIDTATPSLSWQDFESITVSTTALPLTEAKAEVASVVQVVVETAAVRFRIDGQDPTATVGIALAVGDILNLNGFWEIDKFRAIRRDGADATLRVTYGVRRYD